MGKNKESKFSLPVYPCHFEILQKSEESQKDSKRDISLTTQVQYDNNIIAHTCKDSKTYHIAFDFMESFIKVLKKESIKSINLYKKEKIQAYKAVIHKNTNAKANHNSQSH
ncbi:hypothetical protein [Helicobacter mesocricetorum]|uniref:hypothetical protein n=1 Tax=Helicobacter mesocricetorum TaxID=87012 RepID=UPI000CF079C7|nr:hypothetical protein [Helicobacter mesocricetorum]